MARASLAALVAALTLLAASASAQILPMTSGEGFPLATAWAKDSLGGDAVRINVLTGRHPLAGNYPFDIETGASTFWVYGHYGATRGLSVVHAISKIGPSLYGGVGQPVGPAEGVSEALALDTSGAFASSAAMAGAIRGNSVYQSFRAANGAVIVPLAYLALGLPPDVPGLPNGFPSDVPIWTVLFVDDADTTKSMACFVATTTGQTICITAESAGIDDDRASITMQVLPSPAIGRTRVTLASEPTHDRSRMRLGLYDAEGSLVLDLTPSLIASGYRHAEFDASALPAGRYYCRAVGERFDGVVGTVVTGE